MTEKCCYCQVRQHDNEHLTPEPRETLRMPSACLRPQAAKKSPVGSFLVSRVAAPSVCNGPWRGRASCWPLPQQLLPVSAAGSGRRCCRSHPVGTSTVVAAAFRYDPSR